MINVIVAIVILILVGAAFTYIVREKKKGSKCIGCPAAGSCSGKHQEDAPGCSCTHTRNK